MKQFYEITNLESYFTIKKVEKVHGWGELVAPEDLELEKEFATVYKFCPNVVNGFNLGFGDPARAPEEYLHWNTLDGWRVVKAPGSSGWEEVKKALEQLPYSKYILVCEYQNYAVGRCTGPHWYLERIVEDKFYAQTREYAVKLREQRKMKN